MERITRSREDIIRRNRNWLVIDMQTNSQTVSSRGPAGLGIICGAGAGALWGLVFLAPALVRDFSPLLLTIGRYLAYGITSVVLIAPNWRRINRQITSRDWLALAGLSLAGNTLYYLLLSGAVQLGGIPMTSLVIGFLPVLVTIVGSRDSSAVPLGRLWPSLLLCVAGAMCVGWQGIMAPAAGSGHAPLMGLLCAIGALVSWTIYAVGNSKALQRLTTVTAQEWNLLTGVVTGAQSVVLVPAALILGLGAHSGAAWLQFAAVSAGVALLASIAGNALWNTMSRLLPLTLVGQMILFETLFALLYGFAWERRLPTRLESAAFVLVVLSVVSCISTHRRPEPK